MIWEETHCIPSELMSRNFPEGAEEKKYKYFQAVGILIRNIPYTNL
jgi:hypothetical protein